MMEDINKDIAERVEDWFENKSAVQMHQLINAACRNALSAEVSKLITKEIEDSDLAEHIKQQIAEALREVVPKLIERAVAKFALVGAPQYDY